MAPLSEWLQIMLAEIARKREDAERAQDEEKKRAAENAPVAKQSAPLPRAS
jgi:hypothetical protein